MSETKCGNSSTWWIISLYILCCLHILFIWSNSDIKSDVNEVASK